MITIGKREDTREVSDLPVVREHMVRRDHEHRRRQAEDEGALELIEDRDHLLPEQNGLDLFRRRAPVHFDFEEVAQDGLRDVEGDVAQEDGEHGDPLQVFEV